jgi:UDP-N-acetyl-D-mannosaminuronic acid dehydrogenase
MTSEAFGADTTVCVIGVGFVGLTLSVTLCDFDMKVLAWEKNTAVREGLASGKTSILEPGLQEKLKAHTNLENFKTIETFEEAKAATIYILTVGTPIKNGEIDLTQIENALMQVSPALDDHDLIVIRSTTAVGTCKELIVPLLQRTGKKVLLAMCPERTVEGRALDEMTSLPQIIGSDTEEGYLAAAKLFSAIGTEIVRVKNLESAELTKLLNNTYRDLMFAFANEIAEIALEYNVNVTEIIQAANYNYSRSNIALPGLSGGPCLEKDPWILVQSGIKKGLGMEISSSSRLVNERVLIKFLSRTLADKILPKKIALLGLAFKGNPPTLDLRGSPVYSSISYLKEKYPDAEIIGFEPAGKTDLDTVQLKTSETLEESVKNADLIILLTNSLDFNSIPAIAALHASRECLIIDYWKRNFSESFLPTQSYVSWAGVNNA